MGANDTRTIKVVVTGDSSSARHAIGEVGKEAEHSKGKFDKLAAAIAGWGTKGVIAVGAVGGAAAVMGVKTASEMEQAQFAFQNMLGSGEKAKKFLDGLKDFAAHTPFDFPELAKSSQMLLAMGFNAKQIIPTMTAIGDAVAGMGGSQEQIEFVARALGQMQAKGKVAGDELLQLTEQGIPALKILADGYGVSTQKMSKMVEKGKVLSDKAIPLLVAGLENGTKHSAKFGGMMAKQAVSAQGRWSTMMDTIHEGLGDLASMALPGLNKAMIFVTDNVDKFFKGLVEAKGPIDGVSGKANTLGLAIRAFFQEIKDGDVTSDGFVGKMETIGAAIHDTWGWIHNKLLPVLGDMKQAFQFGTDWESHSPFETAAVGARLLVDAFKQLLVWLKDVLVWFNKHRFAALNLGLAIGGLTLLVKAHEAAMAISAAGGFLKYLRATKLITAATKVWTAVTWLLNAALDGNPIGIVVLALTALVAGFILAYEHSEKFRKIVSAAWDWIKKASKAVWDYLSGTLFPQMKKQLQIIGHNIDVMKGQFIDMWKATKSAFQTGVRFVINMFLTMVGALLHGAAKAFGWVPGIGGKLKGASKAFDKFKRDVNASLGGITDQKVNVGVTFKAGSRLAYDARHQGLAGGGPVRGPGTGTSDDVPTWLSNGEHVLTAKDVIAAGGHGAIMRWRRALHRAGGGPIIASHFPSHSSITREEMSGVLAAARSMGSRILAGIGGNGGGVNRWVGLVLEVLSMLGQPSGLLGAVLRRIKLESGGNPGAINLWDSNARAGHPSQGLMQVIPGTFAAYGGPFRGLGILNPLANIYAGLNYALHRYGSISAIDPLVRPYGYDNGGYLQPGLTLAYNGTGKPEAVFTDAQMRAGGVTVYVKVEGSVVTEKELVKSITLGVRDELLKHAARNGGRTGLPGK